MTEALDLNLRSYPAEQETHSHGHHQAIFPLFGTMELQTEGFGTHLNPESVAVIPAGQAHTFGSLKNHDQHRNSFLIVDAASERFAGLDALWDAASHNPVFLLDSGVQHLMRFAQLQPQLFTVTEGNQRSRDSLALLLMQGLATGVKAVDPMEPVCLKRAQDIFQSRLADPLELNQVAAAAGASLSTLNRLFHRWHGMSPGKYLAQLRLRRAQELLVTSEAAIAEIAAHCGYSEQSALTRAMKKGTGQTPAQYRRARSPQRQS